MKDYFKIEFLFLLKKLQNKNKRNVKRIYKYSILEHMESSCHKEPCCLGLWISPRISRSYLQLIEGYYTAPKRIPNLISRKIVKKT